MIKHTSVPRSVQFEEAEDTSTNASANATMGEIVAERLSRRDLAKGILAVSAMTAAVSPLASLAGACKAAAQ
jgi:secreted PhoX family phosphatase